MSSRSRQITPIKQRYHEINTQSPKLQEQLGYGNLMKRVEDSCKEKARLRRIEQCNNKRNSLQTSKQTNHEIAQEIFNDLFQEQSFLSENDFTQDDYNEMISFIEDEYDYQYSKLFNEYEDDLEAAVDYYDELNDELNNNSDCIPCPVCCSGFLREIAPSFTTCSKCNITIPYPLNQIRQQFAFIYQQHPCNKALVCTFFPNQGLQFSCNQCGFCKVIQ